MEPETNPTPGTPPQPETPNPEPQPELQAPQPAPETPAPEVEQPSVLAAAPAPESESGDWPGAFGAFKRAAAVTKVNGMTILTFNLLAIILSGLGRKQSVLTLVAFLVSTWTQLALISLYLAGARQQKQSFGEAAKVALNRYIDGFLAGLLTTVLLILSFVALVIPFFFVLPRLQLVPYYIVDKKLGPIEAIKASWHDSKGYSLKVWGAIGVSILFGILCLVLVGIYLLFMYQSVFALLYLYINRNKVASPNQPVSEPAAAV